MGDAAGEPASSSPPPPELTMVARAVQRLVARNDGLLLLLGAEETTTSTTSSSTSTTTSSKQGGTTMAAFEAARAPPRIGVGEYLERMHRYAVLEPECYVVAYAYVDRAAHRRPAAAVASTRNVHRLLLACLLVASKVLDDFHHSNAFFARVGGVSNAEMNKLELELLLLLDFEVAVCHRAYDTYREHLEKEMLRNGGGAAKARPSPAVPSNVPAPPPLPADVAAAPLPNGVAGINPSSSSVRELWAVDY